MESNIQSNVIELTDVGNGEINDKISNSESTKGDEPDKPGDDVHGKVYDLPFITNFIRRHKMFTYVPFSSTFWGYLYARPKS